MTTLTTRPLPLLPLAIPAPIRQSASVEPLCNDRSSVTSSSLGSPLTTPPTPTPTAIVLQNQIIVSGDEEMHPDNLLLQGHGVTSPRLSSTNSTNNIDSRDRSLGIYNNTNNSNKILNNNNNNNCDLLSSNNVRPILGTFLSIDSQNSIDNNRNSSSENDSEMSSSYHNNSRKKSSSSLEQNNLNHNLKNDELIDDIIDDDETIDRMSCCSEDSELSVGQEGGCDNNINKNISEHNNNNNNQNNSSKKILNNNRKFLLENSNSDFNKLNSRQQQHIMMLDDSESVDNISNISDIDNRGGIQSVSVISENLQSNDDLSNDSNRDHHLVDPTLMMATAAAAAAVNGLRVPVPSIVRPSPTRIQEEFLRKSHLYAEELMKQQMQFMAAARASAFSLRHNVAGGVLNSQDMGKVGFRPHVKQQNSSISPSNIQQQNENLTNFSGIHSHLNAISKISSQLGGANDSSALSKFTAFGMAAIREHSQSPPPIQQLNNLQNHHHQMHQLHPHLQFLNNNFHEPSLKFSIDNILKADFGRRITDPLLKRSGGGLNNRKHSSKAERQQQKNQTAIDLTNLISHNNNNNNQISSGLSSVSSNCSSDSSSTINTLDKNQRVTPIKSPSITSPTNPTSNSSAQSPTSATTAATGSSATTTSSESSNTGSGGPMVWPAWVYCTRYSDRPSSGRSPRTKKPKKAPSEKGSTSSSQDDKRPRTAFSGPQLARLKHEFAENRYLTEKRRQQLSNELGLNEAQIKIWFQNKRAKIKKSSGSKNPLALQLMAQGLYNHSTVPLTREEEELQELQAQNASSA